MVNVHPARARDGSQVKVDSGKLGWRMEYMAGKDPATGKPRRVVERFYGTERQAKDYWGARQAEIDAEGSGTVKVPKETVSEFMERFLRTYGEQQLKPSTLASYRAKTDLYIVPTLGALPIRDLTTRHVDEALARLVRPKAEGGFGVAPRTAAFTRAVLRRALNVGMRKREVSRSVADAAAFSTAPQGEPKRVGSYTHADMQIVGEAARGHRLEALFTLAWQSGLRMGEILGLRWADVDLGAGTVTVRQTLVALRGEMIMQTPKSRASRRTVVLPPQAIEALEVHRGRQADERRRAGAGWQDNGLVFPTSLGTPIHPRNLERTWYILRDRKKASDEKDAPPVLSPQGFHSLRHTYGSLALSAGVPLEAVSENLGHTDVGFTKRVYADVLLDLKRAAADKMGAFIATGRVALGVTGEQTPTEPAV